MAEKSLPRVNAIDEKFWQGAANGKLLLQMCTKCGKNQFFPRPVCVGCFSSDLDWIPASGKGKIYSFTLVQVPRNPAFRDEVPICFADIVLDEAVLIQSRIFAKDIEMVKIGASVRAAFIETSNPEIKLPIFELI